MNYEQARKLVMAIIFISVGITVALYFIANAIVTIEYFSIHIIICLIGIRWLRQKKSSVI